MAHRLIKKDILTYMSILQMVGSYLGNRLFRLPPSIPSDPTVRKIVVTREVLHAVDGIFPDNYDGIRLSDFRETLDAFTIGEEISVGENPFKKPSNCFLARVDPVVLEPVPEIWTRR